MRLCVALDLPSKEENLNLAKKLQGLDDLWLKVGFRSYIRDGKEIIYELKKIDSNFKIFLDLKLYDIPNTMADAALEIADLGIDMFNIHASSGRVAMEMVMERLSHFENRPLVLAVTALTSFDEKEFSSIYNKDIPTMADRFAKNSFEAGVDGVVCSAFESRSIKDITDKKFITLSPGIRPFDEDRGDQQRVADLSLAKKELVDIIVVGRPIYKSSDPLQITKRILSNI
jgi:orotidine-5'-phosphate decarboxylase